MANVSLTVMGRTGDVNSDGIDEVIVSEPGGDANELGHAYLMLVRSAEALR